MEIAEIIDSIREVIEEDDMIREKALPLTRDAVRKCSKSIKSTHRGEYDKARKFLDEADVMIKEAQKQLTQSQFLSKTKILNTAYQELSEAANFLSLITKGEFVQPDEFDIPGRPYMTGLADTVGELRRAVLDTLRDNELEKSERYLQLMEEIFDELHTLDFPNALIPDLRRKCDVARGIIERTRGDITSTITQERLIEKLRSFEKRFENE
ncbi:MAG: hypothetical protein BAJATHORv1_20290 [Candidatus Thorarchaeota archaeon]|nr:MAG: hypothetical protein BAJATHORv1_20290 [Candidatus Thorarchaeota archaeon]